MTCPGWWPRCCAGARKSRASGTSFTVAATRVPRCCSAWCAGPRRSRASSRWPTPCSRRSGRRACPSRTSTSRSRPWPGWRAWSGGPERRYSRWPGRRAGSPTPWRPTAGPVRCVPGRSTPEGLRPIPRYPGRPGDRLLAGGAVDLLAEEVGVAQVPRVLLDHVQVDHPQRHHLVVAGEGVIQRCVRRRRVGVLDLLGQPGVVGRGPGRVGLLELGLEVTAEREVDLLAGEPHAEPDPLH